MTDILTLRDALLGGPGLDGYAYNADVYCVDCGQEIARQVFADFARIEHEKGVPFVGVPYPDAQDSDTLPQPIFFGESDCEQHCAKCGAFLYGEAP